MSKNDRETRIQGGAPPRLGHTRRSPRRPPVVPPLPQKPGHPEAADPVPKAKEREDTKPETPRNKPGRRTPKKLAPKPSDRLFEDKEE